MAGAPFETGAILIYLAQKTGRFLPSDPRARITTLEWLMWQMGGIGPLLGPGPPFPPLQPREDPLRRVKRYGNEAKRLYGVLDRRLAGQSMGWPAHEYTIADIATWPWITRYEWQTIDLGRYPNVRRWYDAIKARPAVQRGYDVPKLGHQIPA